MSEKSKSIVKRKKKDTQANKQRTNHLLIIGIDKYSNGIAPLNNAVRDAENFRDTLWKQYQFDEVHTTSLFNEEATRENIIETFSKLLYQLTKDDNLLFYYSGHGEQLDIGNGKLGYWIPYDATLHKTSTYLPNTEINNLFKLSNAHHLFGIVDSCYSGALFQTRSLTTAAERIDSFPSRWLLTAGRLELVSDGSLGKNSPFATTLLTYLKNTKENALWTADLCNLVLKGMKYNSDQQTPRGEPLQDVGHYGGQFVFYKKGYVPAIEKVETMEEKDGVDRNLDKEVNVPNESMTPTPTTTSKAPTTLAELKSYIREEAAGDLMKGIQAYKKYIHADSSHVDNSIGLLSRYNRNHKNEMRGTSSEENINRTYNQINYALLSFVDELEEEDIQL